MLSGWRTKLAEQISLSGNSQIEEKNWFAESKQKALEESLVAKKAEIKKIREDSAKLKKKQNQVKVVLHSSSAKTDSSIPPAKKNKENSSNNVKADSSLSPPKKKQKLTN